MGASTGEQRINLCQMILNGTMRQNEPFKLIVPVANILKTAGIGKYKIFLFATSCNILAQFEKYFSNVFVFAGDTRECDGCHRQHCWTHRVWSAAGVPGETNPVRSAGVVSLTLRRCSRFIPQCWSPLSHQSSETSNRIIM